MRSFAIITIVSALVTTNINASQSCADSFVDHPSFEDWLRKEMASKKIAGHTILSQKMGISVDIIKYDLKHPPSILRLKKYVDFFELSLAKESKALGLIPAKPPKRFSSFIEWLRYTMVLHGFASFADLEAAMGIDRSMITQDKKSMTWRRLQKYTRFFSINIKDLKGKIDGVDFTGLP